MQAAGDVVGGALNASRNQANLAYSTDERQLTENQSFSDANFEDVSIWSLLTQIEKIYNLQIVYAAEVSSRGWSLASPDTPSHIYFVYMAKNATSVCNPDETSVDFMVRVGKWEIVAVEQSSYVLKIP